MIDIQYLTRYVQYWWGIPLALLFAMLAIVLTIRMLNRRSRRLAQLGTPDMIQRLAPVRITKRTWWRPLRFGLAALLIGAALAGPRWGSEGTVVRQSGVDVVLAIDASTSMLATDDSPNRLARLKDDVRKLRERSPGDRFGLIAFAGKSYVLSPLTVDNGALDLYLDHLDPVTVGQTGSSIASAIRQGVALLSLNKAEGDRALIVLSDGEAFESMEDVEEAGKKAADKGISLITVGYGTEEGSLLIVRENGALVQKKDENGSVVISRYNPNFLRAAAQKAGGEFIPATTPDKPARIRAALNRLRAKQRTVTSKENLAHRFQWFVLPALLILLYDSFLQSGRRRVSASIAALFLFSACSMQDKQAIKLYNSGLQIFKKDTTEAVVTWRQSSKSRNKEVNYRSLFNIGYAHLTQGLEKKKSAWVRASDELKVKTDSSRTPLDSALANYRLVLRSRPNDMDAKWNYELALKSQKKQSGGGGGGGGEGGQDKTGTPNSPPASSNAAQILRNAEQQEQDVQGKRQRKNVPTPPRGKDW